MFGSFRKEYLQQRNSEYHGEHGEEITIFVSKLRDRVPKVRRVLLLYSVVYSYFLDIPLGFCTIGTKPYTFTLIARQLYKLHICGVFPIDEVVPVTFMLPRLNHYFISIKPGCVLLRAYGPERSYTPYILHELNILRISPASTNLR